MPTLPPASPRRNRIPRVVSDSQHFGALRDLPDCYSMGVDAYFTWLRYPRPDGERFEQVTEEINFSCNRPTCLAELLL